MAVLEDLPNKIIVDLQPEDDIIPLTTRKATVIDGMAIVQAMGKPPWIKTCAQWADHFIATLDSKSSSFYLFHSHNAVKIRQTRNKSIVPRRTMHTGRMSGLSTKKGVHYYVNNYNA